MLAVRPRSVLGIALCWCVLGLVSGCGFFDQTDSSAGTTPPNTTVPNPEVIDPGQAPRKILRLALEEGTTTTAELTLDLDLVAEPGPDQLVVDNPTVIETVTFTVDEVRQNEADLSFGFTDVAIDRTGSDLTDEEYLGLLVGLQELVGLGGSATVDEQGRFLDIRYRTAEDTDPGVASMLDQFEDQISTLVVPLPSQPLGIGGSWRARSQSTVAGIAMDQVATYEIIDIDGGLVSYRVTSSQTGSEQDLDPTGLSDGTTARLVSANVSGTGTGTLDLSRAVATSETALSGTQELSITENGSTRTSRQQVDVRLAVTATEN